MVIREEKIIKTWSESWHIPKAATSSFSKLWKVDMPRYNDMRKMRTKVYC